MNYRYLGQTGLPLSELSLGSWRTFGESIPEKTADELMTLAYESGINFFDNAEVYAAGESELVMGRILKAKGWRRDTWCVSSKVFWGGNEPTRKGLFRKHVIEACHQALQRLQVDYLDLYFCHRPDHNTPIVETVAAMTDLVRQGKILYWGTSEWTARDIALAHVAAARDKLVAPVMEQPQYNLFTRERFEVDYSRLYKEVGLGTTVWSPLSRGELVAHYLEEKGGKLEVSKQGIAWLKRAGLPAGYEARVKKVVKFASLARELEITPARLALAWVLKNSNVTTAILGASNTNHLKENLKAVGDASLLTNEVMERIESIFETIPMPEETFC
ncbi:MAG: aldo/keto reductase [Verrucomicrobiota bacterium]|nr:aldo/keto reductase [Verrucomicrobiota bacterium]MEC8614159.1 aldo/keto reductase [Verrucomicrobiota bacterium]